MKTKTKASIQNIIFFSIYMISFIAAGGVMGKGINEVEKIAGHDLNLLQIILTIALFFVLYLLSYLLQMYLHECGHVLFGSLSGYKFSSIRFGSIIFVKTENGIKVKKYKMGGTGGQAIMTAPDCDPLKLPTFWYNMGGVFVNLFLSFIFLLLYFAFPGANVFFRSFSLMMFFMGLGIALTNGLPFTELGVDGGNTLIFQKSPEARLYFRNSFLLVDQLAKGISIKDLDPALYAFDWNTPLDNMHISGGAIQNLSIKEVNNDFSGILEKTDFLLEKNTSLHPIHKSQLISMKIFAMIMTSAPQDDITAFYKNNLKDLKRGATLLDYQRRMYAYCKKVEGDEKKAAKFKAAFEQIAKSYPYPTEVDTERELMALVD